MMGSTFVRHVSGILRNGAPLFPVTVTVVGGVSIKLLGDGTYEGDMEAFARAARAAETGGEFGSGLLSAIVWLIIRDAAVT